MDEDKLWAFLLELKEQLDRIEGKLDGKEYDESGDPISSLHDMVAKRAPEVRPF